MAVMNTDKLNYSVLLLFLLKAMEYFLIILQSYLDIGKTSPPGILELRCIFRLTYYIIPGKMLKGIISKFQSLVGTQPLPPRWAFGNLMSRFGYRSQEQLWPINCS